MRVRTLIPILCLLIFASVAWAAPTATGPHLAVQLVVPPAEIYPGQNFTAGVYFKLDPGWHVYWINAGDSGEPPRVRWTLPEGVTADPMQFPVPKRLPLGPLMDFGYENEVLFPVPMHVSSDFKPDQSAKTVLSAKVDWIVCREVCIPGKATIDVERKALASPPSSPTYVSTDQQLIARFARTMPQPLPSSMEAKFMPTVTGFNLTMITGRRETAAQFFPFDQNQLANAAPQPVTPLRNGFDISLKKDENLTQNPGTLYGLTVLADGNAFEIKAEQGRLAAMAISGSQFTPGSDFPGIARVAGLAFIGGMILNLMPCVFPVLFIKGLSLLQSSQQERHQLRAHGWVYTLGILVSFWIVVALLLILRAGGHQLGWGFQFQSPVFIGIIALLLFFLGLSLAGMFEIGLSLTSKGSGLAMQHGYAGSFFAGVLAMVVATPCTAPFMGAALGYALAHSALVSFVVFTALALGLAAPYLFLTFNPAWTKLLPRPGAWMEVLKQATSIPIFATVIWLVWLFAESAGTNALFYLLSAFLLLAIAGWILGRWPARLIATTAATFVLILAVALPVLGARKGGVASAHANTTAAKSQWEPFSPAQLEKYRAQGRPVFIDFTADWCLSCQVNERVILNRADVQQKLRDGGFVLVRADWTNADPAITQTLNSLGRSGVPTYAIYSGTAQDSPQVLPEVLTPGVVLNAIDRAQQKQASLAR